MKNALRHDHTQADPQRLFESRVGEQPGEGTCGREHQQSDQPRQRCLDQQSAAVDAPGRRGVVRNRPGDGLADAVVKKDRSQGHDGQHHTKGAVTCR